MRMSKLIDIKVIVLDVDGTMTDGGVYIDNNRVESKKFSIKDGAGIKIAQKAGIEFVILTGRKSNCVLQRAEELGIKNIYQDIINKGEFLEKFFRDYGYSKKEVAYIGDDLNDLEAMKRVELSVCPSDACEEVKNYVDIISSKRGGEGVVREFVEVLLKERNLWTQIALNLFS